MKKKLGLFLAAISLLCVVSWSGQGQRQSSTKTWEYKVVMYGCEEKLNELGEQGWELVSVTPAIPTANSSGTTVHYFKRAK